MTRMRLSLTAAFAILGAAIPAFAQAPAPAPAPVVAPAMAPAPAPEAVMPAAPVMAARPGDDMSGSVGFGVGVIAGTNDLIKPDTGDLMLKYWLNDAMALVPRLNFQIAKAKGQSAAWVLNPELVAEFTLLKGASTRFEAGGGLGLQFGKYNGALFTGADASATQVEIYIPVVLDVEHFFTRWFAMGIGSEFRFLDFQKQGDPWRLGIELSDIRFLGSLFFYTD